MPWLVYLKTSKDNYTVQVWREPSYIYSQIGTNRDGTPRFGYAAEQFVCKKELSEETVNENTLDQLIAKYSMADIMQESNATRHLYAGGKEQ